jgi:Ca2+-binding EF-hand superfamily protein
MKTSANSIGLCILTATLFAIPALAQTPPPASAPVSAPTADETNPESATAMEKRHQELIKRFDKNGDGKLDEAEKAAAREEMKKEGENPRGLGGAGGGHWREEMLKRFDKNGDGKLDEAERAEMRKARQLVEQNGGFGRYREAILRRFDKDGDGRLNEAERAEAQKFRAEQIRKFDKDGDGRLNDEERTEAFKAFMAEDHPAAVTPAAK